MSGFSDDCRWWWNGQTWIPTSQVVLPNLPPTAIETSGQLAQARSELSAGRPQVWWWLLAVGYWHGVWPVNRGGLSVYRAWTLEQLALAVDYLLGPNEPMVAGEMSRYDLVDTWTRDLAIAVTSAHVIVFRIDNLDGQPRWIGMAARAAEVTIRSWSLMSGLLYQGLEVRGPNAHWFLHGLQLEAGYDPQPVIEAWRRAANATRAG